MRFSILKAYKENNTYSSADFIRHVDDRFSYAIECIQTDNDFEFTNRLNRTCSTKPMMFENMLKSLGIWRKLINSFVPRYNGKVERSHRKGNEEFYALHKFYFLPTLNTNSPYGFASETASRWDLSTGVFRKMSFFLSKTVKYNWQTHTKKCVEKCKKSA